MSILRDIFELMKKGAAAEHQQKIAQLQEIIIQFQEENFRLREKVRELREAADVAARMTPENGLYWQHREDGAKDGPFCQKCLDVDRKAVRLQDREPSWLCLSCTSTYPKSPKTPVVAFRSKCF